MAPCHRAAQPGAETLPDPAPPTEAVPVSLPCLLHTPAAGTAPDLPVPYSYLWASAETPFLPLFLSLSYQLRCLLGEGRCANRSLLTSPG